MSWLDKLNDQLTITTGDGKVYSPQWMNAEKAFEFNVAEFIYPNVAGEKIERGEVKARRFPLEVYFQGDDHLDIAAAFELSSYDKRAWTILHPFYGSIIVHPLSLNFDNTRYNVTKITGTVVETITEDNPKTIVDPVDNINISKTNLDAAFLTSFDVTPTATDVNTLTANNKSVYTKGVKIIKIPEQAENYFNLFNNANTLVNTATASPLAAMRATQALINAPALFISSVKTRVDLLTSQFDSLRSNITGITGRSSKKVYENTAGALISAQAQAAGNPIAGDYQNRTDVFITIEIIINNYNIYLADLDGMQTANGGSPNSYIPDADSLTQLSELLNMTISSLFTIALSSRQERSVILTEDSNWILLTHRFYGLDPFDNNINELMVNNNAGLNEILQVQKGRRVVYYI